MLHKFDSFSFNTYTSILSLEKVKKGVNIMGDIVIKKAVTQQVKNNKPPCLFQSADYVYNRKESVYKVSFC
ncbi:hypothetical protein J41TS2_24070 [Bacillus sonorensis]|nr:hypothetical protein J41TS2_24070 [Bacillus sonorensis]